MNSGHIIEAVGRHLNWRQGTLVPEACVDYKPLYPANDGRYYGFGTRYLADLMWVTRDQYATEIEIKVSRADWRADNAKAKWTNLPGWVTRFIYAVPEALGIPDFVHPKAGIWHVYEDRNGHRWVRVARAPKRIGKERVPDSIFEWWKGHLYYRYWNLRLHGPRNELPKLTLPEMADAAE